MKITDIINIFKNNFCSISDVPTSQSMLGQFWKGIISLPSDMLLFIVAGFCLIVLMEIITRNKNSYNSANGFTTNFNRMVGSLTYAVLQILTYLVVFHLIGNGAYCLPWPYVAHAAVFASTWWILHIIGFWPDKPKPKKKYYRKKKW